MASEGNCFAGLLRDFIYVWLENRGTFEFSVRLSYGAAVLETNWSTQTSTMSHTSWEYIMNTISCYIQLHKNVSQEVGQ
jgi:hypothetical protein